MTNHNQLSLATGPRPPGRGVRARHALWSGSAVFVTIGAPLIRLAVPGLLAFLAYQMLGCTLAQAGLAG